MKPSKRRKKPSFRVWLLVRVIFLVILLNYTFGVLFYFAERKVQPDLTPLDGVWWAMVTMTTVGYGDFSPQTIAGRFLVAYGTILLGVGVIGYMAGAIAETLIAQFHRRRRGLLKIKFSDHIILCNFPSITQLVRIVEELRTSVLGGRRPIVLVSGECETIPPLLDDMGVYFVHGDPSEEETLKRAALAKCHGVFVLPNVENDAAADNKSFVVSASISRFCEERKLQIKVVVMLVNERNRDTMLRFGASAVIAPEGLKDGLMVQEFLYPGLQETLRQLLSNQVGCQLYILPTKLKGKTLQFLREQIVHQPLKVQVLGIRRSAPGKKREVLLNPDQSILLGADDALIVLADNPEDFYAIEKELV